MDVLPTERLARIRPFPPVVHPAHAREALAGGDPEAVAGWTGGYAITTGEHRRLVEEVLDGLCRQRTGQAALLNGLYGTGKSHLLVLLHLLLAHPPAWDPFLDTHPEFRRFREPLTSRRLLVVHFSLEEYGPASALEAVMLREVARALGEPAAGPADSRLAAWTALLDACRARGYDGPVLLADELSLFLAGKTPARREADAAFLQFLAGWTGRAPVWFFAAMQRTLADVGPLRAHSWRQVEDRFRRHTLSPQQIGDVLREKLVARPDPAAVRAVVDERILPAAAALRLPADAFHANWPFHPATIDLLMAVVNNHLSPHRGAVEIFQHIAGTDWLRRPPERLITPLEVFGLLADDLRDHARPVGLWQAVETLRGCAEAAPDPALARQLIALLLLLHLAERPAPVARLRALLFDGCAAPEIAAISANLHALRRHGAYLAVSRDADPASETFLLAIDDEAGALARGCMLEMRAEMTADDPRAVELALQACRDPAWPFNAGAEGLRLSVAWRGAERAVRLISAPALTAEFLARHFDGLRAGQADGAVILPWPGVEGAECWRVATALLEGPHAGTFLLWQPRPPTEAERELWLEYAAWERAATAAVQPAGARERRARGRCRERADELRPAVEASIRRLYLEGHRLDGRGHEGAPGDGASMADVLAGVLAVGFDALFPLFPSTAGDNLPPRAAVQQLAAQVIEPGQCRPGAQPLLAEYAERFLLPLGCAEFDGALIRVTPPRWELLAPVLAALADGPLRVADAVALLQRPPFGLSTEQARLLVLCAARVGAVQGLDGFLQPLDPAETPLARSDTLAFVGAPRVADEAFRPLVLALAARWSLPVEPWPVACSQLERRLRGWLREWEAQLPAVRAALAEWGALPASLPWQWAATEAALARMERLLEARAAPLEELLALIGEEAWLTALEAAREAAHWWRAQREAVALLPSLPAAPVVREEIDAILARLAGGEAAFPACAELGERIAAALTVHHAHYERWHQEIFGAPVVEALRGAFEAEEFRAVKALARLPLPPPETALSCLEALARARARYCPGIFTRLEAEGCCARCHLPYGSPSPMPDAAAVRQWADEALREYPGLLGSHPWAAAVRERLPRAPEAVADRARALLAWEPADGATSLLALFDDALLAWLCRDRPADGVRRLDQFQQRLAHRDLTLEEARAEFARWLDPEETLDGEAVLRFE